MDPKEKTPAATGEAFGISEALPELEEPSAEAQTGETPTGEEVAPEEAGQTAEVAEEGAVEGAPEGQTPKTEGLIAGKFKTQEELEKAYLESESSRSKLDKTRVELEAERDAQRPILEKANQIIDRQTQLQEKKEEIPFEERRDKFLVKLGEDPEGAIKELIQSPDLKKAFTQSVEEANKPYEEARMKEKMNKMLDDAKTEITVENGYPVSFESVQGKIGQILEQRPWLRQDPECLILGYETLLRQEPELLKNWTPSAKKTSKKPPVTETGAPSSSKTPTPKDPDEEFFQEIQNSDGKSKEKEGIIFF